MTGVQTCALPISFTPDQLIRLAQSELLLVGLRWNRHSVWSCLSDYALGADAALPRALIVAEAANLLMAENRARDKDRWMKDAKLLQDVGSKAYKMAKAKDLEGLKGLNDELYEACQSCHEHYRPGYRRRL